MRPYASLEFSYWYDLHELVFSAFGFLLSHFSMCMFLFACSVLIHAVNIVSWMYGGWWWCVCSYVFDE